MSNNGRIEALLVHGTLVLPTLANLVIEKTVTRVVRAWEGSASRAFLSVVIETMRWRAALILVLTVCMSMAQGVQLLLVIPLMQLVGVNAQQGSVGWLFEFVSSVFATFHVQPTLVTVLGAFVLVTTLLALVSRWQTMLRTKLVLGFLAFLRRRLYRAIAKADWLTFSRERASNFTYALTTESDRVGAGVNALFGALTSALMLLIYVLLALRLSTPMTALVLVSGSGLVLLLKKKRRAARLTGEDISQAGTNLYAAAIEHLGGMKTVKSYGMEGRSADIFSKTLERVNRTFIDAARNVAESALWFSTGSVLILSTILYVAIKGLDISAAGLLLLLFIFNRMIPLFNSIQQNHQNYLQALPAFIGVTEMLARYEAAAEPRATQPEVVELRESIQFDRVSFVYGAEEKAPAIRDLNLTIMAGKTTAIVGPSGAGKSTIADLVMGLILPNSGRVLVDGRSLDSTLMRSWRHQIGYVSQDTFLFNDTVRANLLWACPDADEERIWQTLNLAAADDFVSRLPEGLETVLGDRGVRLSGGERQRLALARALLRKPSLLILDEATSALDSENERRIQSAIEGLHGSVTMLVITHRLSTVQRADVIYVLERGCLVESGSWKMLLTSNGRFKELASAQEI